MNENQQELIDDLNIIEDPQERLSIVVDRAKRHPALNDSEHTDANRVPGCISQVWLISELRDNRCHFRCDADGPLVKGLVALLCDFFSDTSSAETATSEADPLAELGLLKNLSPTRQNGLAAVRSAIRSFAQKQSSA